MNNAGNKSNKFSKVIVFLSLISIIMSCNGQENPRYIGARYGVFELDKINFSENLDTLFNKAGKHYRLPKGKEYFDDGLKRYVLKDTVYYIYRIPPRFVAKGTFRFKGLDIKPQEIVDFYTDHSNRLRKMEVSVYLDDKQYGELRTACKEFSNLTSENIRKVNNGKYVILQHLDARQEVQTTLYCLENSEGIEPDQKYFVRISKTSLKITTDNFYEQLNDEIKKPSKH